MREEEVPFWKTSILVLSIKKAKKNPPTPSNNAVRIF
jgi:hypothetical protein